MTAPRCAPCRVTMKEDEKQENYVCPECGHTEPIAPLLTLRHRRASTRPHSGKRSWHRKRATHRPSPSPGIA